MIEGYDIKGFCQENLNVAPFNELSVDKNTKKPLVTSHSTAYDYENYVLNKLFTSTPLKVVDAMFIEDNNIYMFEFKSGFEQLINISNFDINRWSCPNTEICRKDGGTEPILCKDGARYFIENQEHKIRELRSSLHGKLLETYAVLNRFILPKCTRDGSKYTIWFVAVVDKLTMPLDETQDILELMAGTEHSKSNKISDLRTSFDKYKRNGADKLPLYYDKIEVWSIAEFEEKIRCIVT